ncbi:MAG: hemerythrin domain-containing protein [Turneriella sp.]
MAATGTLEALGIGADFQENLRQFWLKNNLKLDIPVIDLQHIWLVYLIMELENEMLSSVGGEFPEEKIRKIMGDLLSFAAEHFSLEEDLFLAFETSDALEHGDKHRHFVQFLSERANELKEGKFESVKVLVSFLKDWLTMHILRDDKQYADFYRDSGINLKQYFQHQIEKHALTIDRGQVAVYKLVSESDEVREIVNENITSNVIKIWNSNNLSIQIPIIDLQHLWLISLIVELDLASRSRNMGTAAREKIFQRVVQGATQYAHEHFAAEERIMEKFKFSGLPGHLRQHQAFKEFVARRALEFRQGDTQAAIKLVHDLREWLLSHIAIEDRKIEIQLRSHLVDVQKFVRELINSGEIVLRKKQIDLYNQVCGLQRV